MPNVTLDINKLQLMVECAIEAKKQIRIQYTDAKGDQSLRFVEPIQWMIYTDRLGRKEYGILTRCHLRENWRHFKLHRIERVLITDYDYEWSNPEVQPA